MPSMAITMSAVFEPCTLMLYWPSTNGVTVVPGSSSARAGVLRIGVGIVIEDVAIDDELRGVVADVDGRRARTP